MTKALKYDWKRDIEPFLDTMQTVEGGYTPAERGVVTLLDGTKVFVKIAIGDMTKRWLKKEIKVYKILGEAGYTFMPRLLAHNDASDAMAIEYLDQASFDDMWDEDKLIAITHAQEVLKDYKHLFTDDPDFYFDDADKLEARWNRIFLGDSINILNAKFTKFGLSTQFTREQFETLRKMHDGWKMKQDTLIHEDIRGDNFGYFADKKLGKLIDWNWLTVGDESLDTTALFVHMYASGFDPYLIHPEKYDAKMLVYLICFWLDSVLVGDEDASDREYRLRVAQATSVKVCLELLGKKSELLVNVT